MRQITAIVKIEWMDNDEVISYIQDSESEVLSVNAKTTALSKQRLGSIFRTIPHRKYLKIRKTMKVKAL